MNIPRPCLNVLILAALGLTAQSVGAVEIVAHRGASHDAPENTLAAQRLAWEQNADIVETDIYLTKDGRIIVIHDSNYKRTADRDAPITGLTLAEAPTLDEIIAQAKAAKLTGLDLQHTWPLTPADVRTIKDARLELRVWTVDDVAIAKHWIELGVQSITTNRPGWLREQLKL
jgi:glycerophosphoryl diester phosphodiesterase